MLERHGVTRIEPLGQRFDPNCHQAMYEVQNADVPEGTVVDVMQAGYAIGDRCLRPALVAVAKGGAKPSQAAGQRRRRAPRKAANDDFPGRRRAGRLTPSLAGSLRLRHAPQREIEAAAFGEQIGRAAEGCGRCRDRRAGPRRPAPPHRRT